MEFPSGYRVILFSHSDFERLTAEIYFGEAFLCLVYREEKGAFIGFSMGEKAKGFLLDGFVEAALSQNNYLYGIKIPLKRERRRSTAFEL